MLRAYSYMPNTYDLRFPKMADLCILRCAEHVYQNGCSVHTSILWEWIHVLEWILEWN